MIAVVIASYARQTLLQRLLASLRACPALGDGLVIIVDNGGCNLRGMVDAAGWERARLIEPGRNLGCAGGVALGLATALEEPAVTHLMVMDDDSVLSPETPAVLRDALVATGGAMAVPVVVDDAGVVGWYPGLQEPAKWRVVKRPGLRPADYLRECGPAPVRITWSAWPVIMFTRQAVELCGLPLEKLWYQGVDLEYTLRVTARLPGYFVPTTTCAHLPPPVVRDRRYYLRECGGLQNCLYVFCRLPHGRRALRHLPGNLWRFFQAWGFAPHVLGDFLRVIWRGGICGRPQGAEGFDQFRLEWEKSGRA